MVQEAKAQVQREMQALLDKALAAKDEALKAAQDQLLARDSAMVLHERQRGAVAPQSAPRAASQVWSRSRTSRRAPASS